MNTHDSNSKANRFPQKGGMLWQALIESEVIQHLKASDLKVLLYYLVMGEGTRTRILEKQQEIGYKLGLSPSQVSRSVNRLCYINKALDLEQNLIPPILIDEERENRKKKDYYQKEPEKQGKTNILRCSIHPFWGHKGSIEEYQIRWHLYCPDLGMQNTVIKSKCTKIRETLKQNACKKRLKQRSQADDLN